MFSVISSSSYFFFFLNMVNILFVTMKPPKMLTDAKVTAIKPMTFEKSMSIGPAASRPLTMITDEMALVKAINGE